MTNYDAKYAEYLTYFNNCLDKRLLTLDKTTSSIITDAMIYAVAGGGKRVRPVLCFAVADMLGISLKEVEVYALAIEMIHSYSLVHDDLPAMDNDDYRRGKLSTHKKFGEANGILAGDALLNYAFETCLSKDNISSFDVNAMRVLFDYSGYNGMIAGQVLDLEGEKTTDKTETLLTNIYLNKTSKLLTAPMLASSCLADKKYFNQLKEFGYALGLMFQITDDIMDVEGTLESIGKTPHKDENTNKLTSISIYGLDGAKQKAKELYTTCKNILSSIENSEFLSIFTFF